MKGGAFVSEGQTIHSSYSRGNFPSFTGIVGDKKGNIMYGLSCVPTKGAAAAHVHTLSEIANRAEGTNAQRQVGIQCAVQRCGFWFVLNATKYTNAFKTFKMVHKNQQANVNFLNSANLVAKKEGSHEPMFSGTGTIDQLQKQVHKHYEREHLHNDEPICAMAIRESDKQSLQNETDFVKNNSEWVELYVVIF